MDGNEADASAVAGRMSSNARRDGVFSMSKEQSQRLLLRFVAKLPHQVSSSSEATRANDEHELIGMGIFHIEDQTRRYITTKLKTLPSAIQKRAIDRRRAIRG
jgi:hypothetical protein